MCSGASACLRSYLIETDLHEVGGLVRDAHAGGAHRDADADEGGEPLDDQEDVGGSAVM